MTVKPGEVNTYTSIVELSGVTKGHLKEVTRFLNGYLRYVNYKIDKEKSIAYFKQLKDSSSIAYYKKQMYQIKKFLSYLKVEWISEIKLPKDPEYKPKRVSKDDIKLTMLYFKGHKEFKQMKALILLGFTSGLRAEEIYQLTLKDIDLKNRIVCINHKPGSNQTTKTGRSRVSFFNREAQIALESYIEQYNRDERLIHLFGKTHVVRLFRKAPISVKDLRKAFSQEWDKRNGSFAVKERLLGHSMKRVDFQHYSFLDENDLKQVYDKVMKNELKT